MLYRYITSIHSRSRCTRLFQDIRATLPRLNSLVIHLSRAPQTAPFDYGSWIDRFSTFCTFHTSLQIQFTHIHINSQVSYFQQDFCTVEALVTLEKLY